MESCRRSIDNYYVLGKSGHSGNRRFWGGRGRSGMFCVHSLLLRVLMLMGCCEVRCLLWFLSCREGFRCVWIGMRGCCCGLWVVGWGLGVDGKVGVGGVRRGGVVIIFVDRRTDGWMDGWDYQS